MTHPRWTRAVAVVCVLLGASACSRSPLTPAGSLGPAESRTFLPPISVEVTRGSVGGEEGTGPTSRWWLTSARATIRVNNGTTEARDLQVTGKVFSPPCNAGGPVTFRPDAGPATTVTATKSPSSFTLAVRVPAGSSAQVPITIGARGCRAEPDPRTLYVALVGLKVR